MLGPCRPLCHGGGEATATAEAWQIFEAEGGGGVDGTEHFLLGFGLDGPDIHGAEVFVVDEVRTAFDAVGRHAHIHANYVHFHAHEAVGEATIDQAGLDVVAVFFAGNCFVDVEEACRHGDASEPAFICGEFVEIGCRCEASGLFHQKAVGLDVKET